MSREKVRGAKNTKNTREKSSTTPRRWNFVVDKTTRQCGRRLCDNVYDPNRNKGRPEIIRLIEFRIAMPDDRTECRVIFKAAIKCNLRRHGVYDKKLYLEFNGL